MIGKLKNLLFPRRNVAAELTAEIVAECFRKTLDMLAITYKWNKKQKMLVNYRLWKAVHEDNTIPEYLRNLTALRLLLEFVHDGTFEKWDGT